ncbi:MAG: hypothetical protein HKM89_10775 [Gemmatimonadales bacterium]|nr:hypothetical protein [Gemmatimonadales bacterium]
MSGMTLRASWLLVVALAVSPSSSRADAGVASCIYLPNSQTIKALCDELGAGSDGGCSQWLASQSENWASRDHHNGGGPAFGLLGSCDIPTTRSERGCKRYYLQDLDVHWTVINMIVVPASDMDLLDPIDSEAVPPDPAASSQWLAEWNCDQTENGLPTPHKGAYGVFSEGITQAPSDLDLLAFSAWDFVADAGSAYREAYDVVRDGYVELRGPGGHHNPHTPGTPESVLDAWKKRWAIMDEMWQQTQDNRALTGREVSEYYLQRYGYQDLGMLSALGLWLWEHHELDVAIDNMLDRTLCGQPCDPDLMYQDIDVSVETWTSWGRAKAMYR